jgi:hypothetical protein
LTLGPQLLVPNQKRLFFELDFAEEQNIEEYHEREQRRDVERQMKKHRDTIEEGESITSDIRREEEEQSSIWKLPLDEKDVAIEGEKLYLEDQSIEIPENKLKEESVERRLSEMRKSFQSSTEDETKVKSSEIKEDVIQLTKDELRKPSIKTLTSDKTADDERLSLSKSASIVLPNITEDLTTTLTESYVLHFPIIKSFVCSKIDLNNRLMSSKCH